MRLAAGTARAIAEGSPRGGHVAVRGPGAPALDLYPVATAPTDVPVAAKIELLDAIDGYARAAIRASSR